MVFESVVTDLLNRILGDYVQNLDSKQLKIGIWGGDVVLNNLILKHSALDDLKLPVQIKYGSLGKLVLKIPWSNLYGASCECFLDSLYLVVVPNNEVIYNEEKESKWAQEAKQAQLIRIEHAKKNAEKLVEEKKVDDSFIEKLTTQIIKNVQVKIQNIHIRYEDKMTNPAHPFSLGITLSNLSIVTTDSDWRPAVVQDTIARIYKELQLEGLAVYWNSDSVLYSNLPPEELERKLQDGLATKAIIPENYVYMLGPINSNARLQLNPKPENDAIKFSIPKLVLDFDMEKLAIGISKVQYRDVMLLVDSMERMSKASIYRKYRPSIPHAGHAKEWWKFAYTCILEEEIRRKRQNWDWSHIAQHRNTCKEYAEVYQQKLMNKKIPADVENKITDCENTLDIVNIVIIRQRISIEVERLGRIAQERKKTTWLSSWWGGSGSADDESAQANSLMKQFQDAMTPEEKKRLFSAIDYQENSSPAEFPVTFVGAICKFNLQSLQIEVKNDDFPISHVLSLDIADVKCCVEHRPAASALKVVVSVDKMTAHGLRQGDVIPEIISSTSNEGIPLLDVLFETNPIDQSCNQRLHLTAYPLKIIYNAATVLKLVEIFKTPEEISSDFSQLSAAAESQLDNFKEFSNIGLQYMISQHNILELKIFLHAPYIIVPYKGFYVENESVLVVNLGQMEISTIPRNLNSKTVKEMHNEGYNEEMINQMMIEQSYDKFILQFTHLQVVVATKNENWEESIHGSKVTPLHLLKPISLNIELHKCVISDDPRMPRMKVIGCLDSLELCFSDARILLLLTLINSIPLPNENLPELQGLKRDSLSKLSTLSLASAKRLDLGLTKRPSQIADSIKRNNIEQTDDANAMKITNLFLKFEMKLLSVLLQHQKNLKALPERLIFFEVNSVKIEMLQKPYILLVNLSLGSISMAQHLKAKEIELIHTPRLSDTGDGDLLSIKYIQVDKKAPNFYTTHKSVEKWVQFDFKMLKILLHQESLIQIIYHMNDFKTKFSKIHSVSEHVSSTAISTKNGLNLEKIKPRKKKMAKKPQNPDVDLKLTANIEEVCVVIENDARPLASLGLKGLHSEVVITQMDTCISMALSNITIVDLNINTIHKMIVTQSANEAINLTCTIFNLEEYGNPDDVDMRIKLSVGGLRIIYLNWFITSILEFLNKFQVAQTMIIEASQAAAQSAKENISKAYDKAMKIDFQITIKAPDIIMPLNSSSKQALLLDLGFITLTNKFLLFDVEESNHQAVIDQMTMTLKQLKLSAVLLDDSLEEGFVSETVILQPVNFELDINRNLSKGWHKSVPDIDMSGQIDSFHIHLAEDDFQLILNILDKNMKEGQKDTKTKTLSRHPSLSPSASELSTALESPRFSVDSTADNTVLTQRKTDMILESLEIELEEAEAKEVAKDDKVYITIKFTFTMNNMIINLFRSNVDTKEAPHSPELGLVRFSLQVLSVKGRILSDNTLTTSLVLVNCLLDDTRIDRKSKLSRYLQRKLTDDTNVSKKPGDYTVRSMIDVTYQQKDLDKFIDCRVSSFQLILAMDYLMQIVDFFTGSGTPQVVEQTESQTKVTSSGNTPVKHSQGKKKTVDHSPASEQSSLSMNLKIEKPDIILIEHMTGEDTNALILNGEVLMKARSHGSHLILNGSVMDLQLNVCLHTSKGVSDKVCSVLHPLSVSLAGSTPPGQGLHVEVIFTDIRLGVSPTTIELLSNIYNTMMTSTRKDNLDKTMKDVCYDDIWSQHQFQVNDYWFLRTDVGEEAFEMVSIDSGTQGGLNRSTSPMNELCIVTIPSIVLTCEAGVGKKTLPMLMLHSSFQGSVYNWSTQMRVDATLTCQMGYYNSRLALWEPLIEPVEKGIVKSDLVSHEPWELKFAMQMNNQDDFGGTPLTPAEVTDSQDEIQFQQPSINIEISSTVNLELTVTKTCLEVLNNLGKAFSNAILSGTIPRTDIVSPYIIRNDCGLQITVVLTNGSFMLCEQESAEAIVLESGARVNLHYTKDKTFSTIDLLNATLTSTSFSCIEQMLQVKIDELKAKLYLPVYRADKRFFSLNHRGDNKDMWGLISDISVEEGSLLVVLRSILKVYNHLKEPVEIYYMTSRGNELESIAIINPGNSYNVPMKAVYTPTSELFFSVAGYSVTASPFVWKDLQLNLSVSKILQCTPKNNTLNPEPFIMKVVGEIEQVYNENTIRHTMASTCYNIHLRTAVVLKNCLPVKITCMIQNSTEEKAIEPGFVLQLPNVDPGKSSIVIRIPEYLEKDWSCKHEIPLTPGQFSVWQFDSHDSAAKMSMDLGMHNENKNGTIELTLYCPNWMLNKTGLLLAYRKSKKMERRESSSSPLKSSDEFQNVLYHPPAVKTPILFSYNAKNFLGKKKAAIRIDQGEWSDKFSLDVAGSAGVVACKANNMIYQIGVSNQLTYNGLTKQITFTPYYVIINNCKFAIECQELERPGDPWIRVEPECCSPLWPKSEQDDKLIKLRVCDTVEITAPFLYTEMHTTLLKLKNKYGGINVDVQMTEGSVFIVLTSYLPGMAPALIINNTPHTMKFWEKESIVIKPISPNHRMLFTWDNPAGSRLLLWDIGHKKELQDDLRKDGVGSYFPLDNYEVFWVSFLDGMQRVLLFTTERSIAQGAQTAGDLEAMQQEISLSIYGVGLSFVNNLTRQEIMYVGITGSGIIWETCKLSAKRYKQMSVRDSNLMEAAYQNFLLTTENDDEEDAAPTIVVVDGKMEVDFDEGVMMKPNKRRIRRTYLTGLWLQMKTSPHQMQIHAKIHRLQIDNQMFDNIFPVVLAPVPPPKSVAVNSVLKPFAELSIVQRLMKHSNIKQFKYYKVLIQEFHIKVDLGFVNAVLELIQGSEETAEEATERFQSDMQLMNTPLLAHVSSQSVQEQKNFYDLLHFSPLKIHVSFSLASGQSASSSGAGGQSTTPPFLNVLLQGVGVTLTDLQDVVFRLAYFQHEYTFLTQRQLIAEAKAHYVGQAIKQLYVLVLGLDVLGNPYGLVVGFTKGMEDLFYEPFQGAIQGPSEFAEGLVLGVRSLFGHTVGGAAGAVSRITGAMGKGLAVLTFDKEYQRKRRDQQKKRPANIQEEIARGGKGLVMGVVDGVTGVFTKPISGAKQQGVEGFFKGLGKGAVGLVTRPTAGVIDFASGSFDFVKRATEIGEETHRLRFPRFLPGDGMVKAFVKWEAHGNKLVNELEKGKYANTDIYAFHVAIVDKKDYLLMTDKRIAYVVRNDIFGSWQIDWAYTWQEVHSPAKVVPKGVAIATGETKKRMLGMFGHSDAGKIVLIGDPDLKERVCAKIEELRQNA